MNDDQAYKMRFISIILGNEELFAKINEVFPHELNEANIEIYINYYKICYQFSQLTPYFDFSTIIEQIAINFSLIEPNKLLTLPISFQYAIISNSHLKIEDEDSLYDYIEKIFENCHQHDEEYYDEILFYEQIEFSSLSQEKLNEFLSKLDIGKITGGLWSKLLSALTHQKDNTKNKRYQLNNNNKKFKYDTNRQNRFEGIIHHLNNQCHGNSAEKGVIDVSIPDMPTIYNFSTHKNSNVVDLKDKMSYVTSKKEYLNWLKIDFKEKRVRPTNYSIRK
ncbi:hypothetical protein M9Y10_006897 [Tritrichomonas musculus]|uniref:Uncharacterized protein n=1 Tax=Tritrichomonas musculus TaxID=1915356 RepID=A0ABR2JG79_9EUKA